MKIADRLRRIGALHGMAPPPPDALETVATDSTDPLELSDASEETNVLGSFLLRQETHALDSEHGSFPLGEAVSCEPEVLSILGRDRALAGLDLSKVLFLDTETTGLAGGTGTIAFLVGVAAWEAGRLRLWQLFMRDFDEEAAMLRYLTELMEGRSAFVSYNGKSFDLPLLAGRFVANRIRAPELTLPHLDLLHTARRLWRHDLPGMSLAELERSVLGVSRADDVPGALIPALYFQYLRTRRFGLMSGVLEHNRLDVLSLVSALAAAARVCRGDCFRTGEHLGVARTHELMREPGEAVAAYRRALERTSDPSEERHVRKGLARALARNGDHEGAREQWLQVAGRWEDLDALEALAKHAEHREKDLAAALGYTRRALAKLESPLLRRAATHARNREAFTRRRERLERRASKESARRDRGAPSTGPWAG